MEKGRRMRRSRRGLGLNGLFWRYLIMTGLLAGTLCLLWLFLFNVLVNMEFVMSAYTAARALPDTEKMLRAQEQFEPEEIPFFYEWALVEDGSIIQSSMSQKQLEYAYDELAGYSAPHGWLYTQHFHFVPLSDGKKVMLEYDYSVCRSGTSGAAAGFSDMLYWGAAGASDPAHRDVHRTLYEDFAEGYAGGGCCL